MTRLSRSAAAHGRILEKTLGSEHPDTAVALRNRGGLYEASGDYTTAEPLIERAQVIEERNRARFVLSGSEARKRNYLLQNGHAHEVVLSR